jgi:hypothetical protein
VARSQIESVLRIAVERGYLSQVDQAVGQSQASGGSILEVLRPLLSPEQIAELTLVFRAPTPSATRVGP